MTGVHELLTVLGDPASSEPVRLAAEAALRSRLGWLQDSIAKKFTNLSRAEIEETIDHLMDKVTSPATGYRGPNGDKSAMAWMRRIAQNKAIDCARARKRREMKQESLRLEEERRRQQDDEFEKRLTLTRNIVSMVEQHVCATMPPAEALEKLKRMRLGIEFIWVPDMTNAKQREVYGYVAPGECDPAKLSAADNLLAQHRHRGRRQLAELVAHLVATHRIDEEDATLFATENKLTWPPPPRRRATKAQG